MGVRAEGQRADGTWDGSAFATYAGSTSIRRGQTPTLLTIVHQSQGLQATDIDYVAFDPVTVQVRFSLFRCTTTCSTTPTYVSPIVDVISAFGWPTSGDGVAANHAPTNLPVGLYRVTVTPLPNGYLAANPGVGSLRILPATSAEPAAAPNRILGGAQAL